MTSWKPSEGIAAKREAIRSLSDRDFFHWLKSIEPLPDDDDDSVNWDDDALDRIESLLAASDEIGDRRLVTAIPDLFKRASLYDAFGLMQSIRHGPERASPNTQVLADLMLTLAGDERSATRRWAVRELGLLRMQSGTGMLFSCLSDPEPLVRRETADALGMIGGSSDPNVFDEGLRALRKSAESDGDESVRFSALRALQHWEPLPSG